MHAEGPWSPDLILHTDSDLLVVHKPAGLPVLPDGYNPEAPYLKGLLQSEHGPLWVVHRLDKDTSGVLVLARNAPAHRSLNIQFEKRQVSKVYHALAQGSPSWDSQAVTLPLRADADRRHRTAVDTHNGKPAATDLRILERFSTCVLVEAQPHTGRTHQIRVHLAAVGLPILADTLYGDRNTESDAAAVIERLALHARHLSFTHPASGQTAVFEAAYPEDFAAAVELLRSRSLTTRTG
jgi:RluA family pseudouridine synthase